MIAWLNTHIWSGRQPILRKICFGLLLIVFITTLFFVLSSQSFASSNKVVGFSARLKNSSGGIVADGYYNVEFKLYNQQTDGSPLWTESYHDSNGSVEGGDNRVRVTNGYLSVKLGSITPFDQNINWSGNLWLTMNIGGTEQEAVLANIPWDGEMSPRIQLAATPYSMDSGAVGGKKINELTQLGQGVQVDGSNNSSIFINKTGNAHLLQLQSSGVDIFTLSQNGNITLGSESDKSIALGSSSDGVGHNLAVSAGSGNGEDSQGGSLVLQGGSATGLNSAGGDIIIDGGTGANGGSIIIGSANSGTINIGNSGSTTKVVGDLETYNIDSINQGVLSIGGANATEIIIGQDTSVNGDMGVKAQQDSSSTFQVQNSTGENLLNVNSSDNRIEIGSANDETTVLVLDKKTSASDPTGTDGAMYYNGHAGKFRCYEGGGWKDCVTPLPISKTVSTPTSNSTTTPVDVSDLSFSLAPNTKYYYKFMIIHESANSTTGVGFGVTSPSNLVANNWCVNTTATTSSTSPGHWGSYCGVGDANATTDGADNLGKYFSSSMEGYIETGNDAGDFKLRLKSESTDAVTVQSGSFGVMQIVQ